MIALFLFYLIYFNKMCVVFESVVFRFICEHEAARTDPDGIWLRITGDGRILSLSLSLSLP